MPLGAKIAQKVGFDAMFQTGYGTSATLFGMPDYGFIGATETVDNARRICRAVSVPVIVDSDTGYGNALSVWKLVKELESAGASGIFSGRPKMAKKMWTYARERSSFSRRIYRKIICCN